MPSGYYERTGQKEWTPKEFRIVWDNLHEFPKTIQTMLDDRSLKSIRNVCLAFRRLTQEDIQFLEDNRLKMICVDMDKERGLCKGTAVKYFKMKELYHMHRPNSYTPEEIAYLEKYAHVKSYVQIAKELNTNESRVRNLASKIGIDKRAIYTKETIQDILKRIDSGETIQSIANSLNKTVISVKGALRRNGYNEYAQNKKSINSIYYVTKPEQYIMDAITRRFSVDFPQRSFENRNYYWGIIPPYEVDIPFVLNGKKFAIEYDGEWWHQDRKESDKEKEFLLRDKGYYFFRISSWMHDHTKIETLEPVVNILLQSIENIAFSEETSTTIERTPMVEASRVG